MSVASPSRRCIFRGVLPWVVLSMTLVAAVVSGAGAAEPWVPDAVYDAAIPTPDEAIGRPFGTRHITVDEMVSYAHRLAAASDRVTLHPYGETVEGDPLILLAITAARNALRLKDRLTHVAVVRDPWTYSAGERKAALASLDPITWIACSVHGDEASGTDAGIMLAYHLAAGQDPATREILDKTVVLVDPCQNPDGRRRFLAHVRAFGRQVPGPDDAPEAIEHNQLWPGGRRNHYMFDLNRDWAFLTQVETQAKVAEFQRWHPQVFADLHEMGRESSYFFPPPTDPVNPHVPNILREWWTDFGRANARAFDERGFDYFVRESFDLFYPGYGDSWPTLMGAIGMTYEQSTTRGLVLRNEAGDVLDYRQAVLHHFTAALTTCQTTARYAREILQSYAEVFEDARRRASSDSVREVVILAQDHPAESNDLVRTLLAQGVTVLRTTEDAKLRLRPYEGGKARSVQVPAGSFRVPRSQPAYPLLRSLLDPQTPLDEQFLRQELHRKERGLTDRFYDVTAWSLVFSYGVQAFHSDSRLDVASQPVEADALEPVFVAAVQPSTYAYLVPYLGNGALRMLSSVLFEGVRTWVALDAFVQDGRRYPRGTLVIKVRGNGHISDLPERLARLARQRGVEVIPTSTAWSDEGPSLGSNRVAELKAPRIAVATGPGVRPASVGSLTWVLEQRYGVPYTAVSLVTLAEVDLFEFDTIVLPEIDGEPALEWKHLHAWVEAGGTLVAIGSSAALLAEAEELDWTTARLIKDLRDLEKSPEPTPARGGDGADEAEIPPEHRPDATPGAVLRVDLEPTSFLTLGGGDRAHVPMFSERLFRGTIEGTNVAIYRDEALAAGFMWPAMEAAIGGKSYLVHEKRGRGHVILFAEDPCFRGTWQGLDRLVLNGALLGPSLDR